MPAGTLPLSPLVPGRRRPDPNPNLDMKRFLGLLLALTGGAAVLWGGYHVLTGQSTARVALADGVEVSALNGGLIGLLVCTLGLIWARD